jgi:hypothetical protein
MTGKRAWVGISTVLGVIVILIPWLLFPVCGHGRFAPPPGTLARPHGCDLTLAAETMLGIAAVIAGLLPLLSSRGLRTSAIATAIIGVFVILFPTVITGVCRSATMPCVMGTRPALVLAGALMVLNGIAGVLLATRSGSHRAFGGK